MKILKENLTQLRVLNREIKILIDLCKMEENVYTTKLLDIIIDKKDQYMFLVMDYCSSDISKALLSNKNSNLDKEHAIIIIFNILTAVNFIHSAGILHRDLKPANILIESDCTVKICDFGLSRT